MALNMPYKDYNNHLDLNFKYEKVRSKYFNFELIFGYWM